MLPGSDTQLFLLARIEKHTMRAHGDLRRIRIILQDLRTWTRRGAILAALYGSGAGLNLSSEQIAELVVVLLKR